MEWFGIVNATGILSALVAAIHTLMPYPLPHCQPVERRAVLVGLITAGLLGAKISHARVGVIGLAMQLPARRSRNRPFTAQGNRWVLLLKIQYWH